MVRPHGISAISSMIYTTLLGLRVSIQGHYETHSKLPTCKDKKRWLILDELLHS